jgi:hypothetical protein
MEAKNQQALDYEQNNIELTTTTITVAELRELCFSAPPSSTDPTMPSSSGAFKVTEDIKVVQIDAEDLGKTVQIHAGLSPK